MITKLRRVAILLPAEQEDLFSVFLAQRIPWGWEVDGSDAEQVRFVMYMERDTDAQALIQEVGQVWPEADCSVSLFEDQDWSQSWKDFFVPVRINDTFMVLPPWLNREEDAAGLIPLYIEPKMAFGTGHHATTALCLRAVALLRNEGVLSQQTRFLDLGTGSGILALACAKLGMTGLALDIDPVAAANAQENLLLNHVAHSVTIRKGGLETLASDQRFDLVLANILAGPLVHMAGILVSHLERGGSVVLSGILRDQAERVENAYGDRGLPAPRRLLEGEWVSLIWSDAPSC